jgi:hypothetical protein
MDIPNRDMVEEAVHIVEYATQRGITLRLLGGLAIRLHCSIQNFCERDYSDIDFMGLSEENQEIMNIFSGLGYTPDRRFNTLHGSRRLKFEDHINERHVDVFLNHLNMDHDWDLSHRLYIEMYTLPLSDLLLTKLQICKINEKDIQDSITLLKDTTIGKEDAPNVINVEYIAEKCSQDWELYESVLETLKTVMESLEKYPLEDVEKKLVESRITLLTHTLITHPKTAKWKLRSAVGKHLALCELVEE